MIKKSNFYLLVNKFLRGLNIEIKDKWLKILKLNSTQDFYDFMMYYINKLTNIIHKNGYVHRDIHDENIMYKKINDKYEWYIIDYGLIFNKKYKLNDTDIVINKKYWKNDKIAFIYSILNKPILDFIEEKILILQGLLVVY